MSVACFPDDLLCCCVFLPFGIQGIGEGVAVDRKWLREEHVHMHRFSPLTDSCGPIPIDVHGFGNFGIAFGDLTLRPQDTRTPR